MRARRVVRLVNLSIAIALTVACSGTGDVGFDRQALERAEDSSESLANDLLAFSVAVRDRDVGAIEGFVADRVRCSELPAEPSRPETIVKWIGWREWSWPDHAETVSRRVFVERLQLLLARFGEIEDARFKVFSADFDDPAPDAADTDNGQAKIKFQGPTVSINDPRPITIGPVQAVVGLIADPTAIPADGLSTSVLTATVLDTDGDWVVDGTVVTFTTSLGAFPSLRRDARGVPPLTFCGESRRFDRGTD